MIETIFRKGFKHFGQQRLNLGTREEQLAPFVRSIDDLNTFADDITIQMGGKLIGLPRNGIQHERIGRAEDEHMSEEVPTCIENEGLAAVTRLQLANVVRREVAGATSPVFAGHFELSTAVPIDHSHAFRQRRVFRGERHGGSLHLLGDFFETDG